MVNLSCHSIGGVEVSCTHILKIYPQITETYLLMLSFSNCYPIMNHKILSKTCGNIVLPNHDILMMTHDDILMMTHDEPSIEMPSQILYDKFLSFDYQIVFFSFFSSTLLTLIQCILFFHSFYNSPFLLLP